MVDLDQEVLQFAREGQSWDQRIRPMNYISVDFLKFCG